MIKAEGHEQSECYKCKQEGKFSLKDNYEHFYCFEHCKKIEEEGK